MKQFTVTMTSADDQTTTQHSCTEADLHRHLGFALAKAVIQETAFCSMQLKVTIENDLTKWVIEYKKVN